MRRGVDGLFCDDLWDVDLPIRFVNDEGDPVTPDSDAVSVLPSFHFLYVPSFKDGGVVG